MRGDREKGQQEKGGQGEGREGRERKCCCESERGRQAGIRVEGRDRQAGKGRG